jgi:hypothetical protein
VIDRSKLFPQHPGDVRKTSQTDVCRRFPEAGRVALHPASARFLNELYLFFLKPAGSSGGFLFFPL